MNEQTTLFASNERERILAAFAARHVLYIRHLRALAVEFARRNRPNHLVTIDDVHREMERLCVPTPEQIGADKRLLGAVLRGCPELHAVGSHLTERKERLARAGVGGATITIYALRNAA